MQALLDKMVKADVIVLASPVYFYSMSGQMKTMLDRTLPRYTEICNKDFYFIATSASGQSAMVRTMDALRGFTDCLPGSKVKALIYGTGVHEKGAVKTSPAMQIAYEAGQRA